VDEAFIQGGMKTSSATLLYETQSVHCYVLFESGAFHACPTTGSVFHRVRHLSRSSAEMTKEQWPLLY